MEQDRPRRARSAGVAHTLDEARAIVDDDRLPGDPAAVASRWAASGGGIAYNREEFDAHGRLRRSSSRPSHAVLDRGVVIGWKEYELEVMRDRADNVVIICSIENFDPMGVHTGDSITVAPAQTLTDKEYQRMRDASLRHHPRDRRRDRRLEHPVRGQPEDGRMIVIEMNPRVSRSSALASKATGFPIAKIAAKLASATRSTSSATTSRARRRPRFEPTIDYVVTKMPRFAFEKFPDADADARPRR